MQGTDQWTLRVQKQPRRYDPLVSEKGPKITQQRNKGPYSTNGARTTGHPLANNESRRRLHPSQKLAQNGLKA